MASETRGNTSDMPTSVVMVSETPSGTTRSETTGSEDTKSNTTAKTPIEILQLHYPTIYDNIKLIYDAVEEGIAALNEALPWFDVYKFLRQFSYVLCVSMIASYSYFMLAFVVVIRRVLNGDSPFIEKEPKSTESHEINSWEGESSQSLNSSNEAAESKKKELTPTQKCCINYACDFAMAFLMCYPSFMFSAAIIFVKACSPVIEPLFALFEHINKTTAIVPIALVSAIGTRFLLMRYVPGPVIAAFLNESLKELWPFVEDSFVKFVKENFPPALKNKCHLTVLKKPDGVKLAPTVLSAKFKEQSQQRILLDLHIFYKGNFIGFAVWNNGGQFQYEDIQVDAKLQIEFTYVNVDHQETAKLSNINFRLKRINNVDFRLEDVAGPMETIKQSKKQFVDAVQDIIRSYFPCHLNLMESITRFPSEETSRPQNQINTIFTNRGGGRQRLLDGFPSNREQVSAPQSFTSLTAGETANSRNSSNNPQQPVSEGPSISNRVPTAVSQSQTLSSATATKEMNVTVGSSCKRNLPVANHARSHSYGNAGATLASNSLRNNASKSERNVNEYGKSLKQNANRDLTSSNNGLDMDQNSNRSFSESISFGQVELTTVFKPPDTLMVTVHKLRNLPLSKGRCPNPYVKIFLKSKYQRWSQGTTGVVDGTTDPLYELYFTFELKKPLSMYTLQVVVKTKRKHNHTIGEAVMCFSPSYDHRLVKERSWFDLTDHKKDQIKIPILYKE